MEKAESQDFLSKVSFKTTRKSQSGVCTEEFGTLPGPTLRNHVKGN